MKLVSLRKAAEMLGMSKDTLRKYADARIIKAIRNPAGQRPFDMDSFFGGQSVSIAYARVGSAGQKADLQRQVEFLFRLSPWDSLSG